MFKMYGIVPPMITPFDEEGNVDVTNLEKLVSFLMEKVDGLFICGSYGCGPLMSVKEREKVAEVTKKVVVNKVPIVVHTGTTNTKETVELSRHAAEIGCNGCSAVGPYYYHHNMESVIDFYTRVVNNVGKDFPVYVYHNPKFSGYEITLDSLKTLKEKGIRGVKDATFNIINHASYQRELKDERFDVVLGTEAMWLSARALGCEAFIPGLGNAFPEICRRMHREGMENDIEKCRKTQFEVNAIRNVMYFARSTQLAVYAMLELRGIIKAYPRSPFIPANENEKKAIRKGLEALGVI
jgi:dihydrodipicolinate synthase/N-acetylneuraminate lyase